MELIYVHNFKKLSIFECVIQIENEKTVKWVDKIICL